jgi:hypothetical protein
MVDQAREMAGRLVTDEVVVNQVPGEPKGEYDFPLHEQLVGDAVLMIAEKLFLEREIDVDQKAYLTTRIVDEAGPEHHKLRALVDLFEGDDIDANIVSAHVLRWVNASPHEFDASCSFRTWAKRNKSVIEGMFGHSKRPIQLTDYTSHLPPGVRENLNGLIQKTNSG